jgi:hypothetical protein
VNTPSGNNAVETNNAVGPTVFSETCTRLEFDAGISCTGTSVRFTPRRLAGAQARVGHRKYGIIRQRAFSLLC